MTYTKQEIVPVDWLSKIEGLRVVDAVEYLKTLEQTLTLQSPELDNAYDVVKVPAHLLRTVPMTREEAVKTYREPLVRAQLGRKEAAEKYAAMGIHRHAEDAQKSVAYYQKRIDDFDKNLDDNIKTQCVTLSST